MKKLLLLVAVGIFAACSSSPNKTDTKVAPAKAETKTADKKEDKKVDKKHSAKKGNFEDEDISKAKPAAKAEAKTEAAAEGKVTCVSGDDSRVLEITSANGKACVLNYTKQGNTQEVASAVAEAKHCEEVREKIKSKLESAGFKCE